MMARCVLGVVTVGQCEQDGVAGGALDQRADRALVGRPADQVALPVSRYGTVLDLCGPFADHDHRLAEARPARLAVAAGAPDCAPPPEGVADLPAQFAARLDVDGLIDGLVACSHMVIIGVLAYEAVADPLGAPVPPEPCGHICVQVGSGPDLAPLGTGPARCRQLIGAVRSVPAVCRMGIAAQLAADRRRAAPEAPGNAAHACAGPAQVGDLDALVDAQIAR